MPIEHVVELLFSQVLVVRQQDRKRAYPLRSDSQLAHQFQGELIALEEGISSTLKNPKHRDPIFGRGGAVGGVQWVAEHMTLLILTVDSRPRTVEMVPRGAGETCLQDLRTLGMEQLVVFDQQVRKLTRTNAHANRVQHLQDFGLTHLTLVVES